MLKRTRQILAALFFIGITLLLLDTSGTLHRPLGWMPKIQLLPALLALNVVVVAVLIVLTLLFGRIYCSVICPLGVMQDLLARLGLRKKRTRYRFSAAKHWLRVACLIVFVGLTVAGFTGLAALIAPYSTFGRIVTHLFQPLWIGGNNILAIGAEAIDSYAVSSEEYVFYGWIPIAVTATTLLLIAVLSYRNGRTWCNTICPVGTVLGYLSHFSFFKVQIDTDKCITCGRCARGCKAACIDTKNHRVDATRCVVCGNCFELCSTKALVYRSSWKKKALQKTETPQSVDKSKRAFLIGSTLLAGTALAQEKKKVDGGLAVIADKVSPKRATPITPPGSHSARNMSQHCTACQLCVSECPNNVLRPSTDLKHFMQPTMSYDKGYCRPECSRCSSVCPTGAIKKILPPEKSAIQIGHAVWIPFNCVPLTDGVSCGNCARHCPTGAITMIPHNAADAASPLIPAIDTEKCIGCGACEHLCPARPTAAIYVEGHENHREL